MLNGRVGETNIAGSNELSHTKWYHVNMRLDAEGELFHIAHSPNVTVRRYLSDCAKIFVNIYLSFQIIFISDYNIFCVKILILALLV